MNQIWARVGEKLNCDYTFGYITKRKRLDLGLDKEHYNDAFIIAGGEIHERSLVRNNKQNRRNNRQMRINRKGFKRSIRQRRYNIQPNDLIEYKNTLYRTKGSHCRGVKILILVDNKIKSVLVKNIKLINYGKGIIC